MMSSTDRLNAYYAQNGSDRLTPRQDRRLISKLRRYDKLTLCPTCGVFGPLSCVTKTGKVAKSSHANRPTVTA